MSLLLLFHTSGTPPSPEVLTQALRIREKPPLRLHHLLTAPSGQTTRWGADEAPENVPSGISFSTTIPGGFESTSATLPRKPGVSYSDLIPFANWRIQGAGGECAWEGQLRDTPRSSGNERAVSPRGAGYQAHLDDDKSARMIYVDQDFSHWEGSSVQRKLNLIAAGFSPQDPTATADETTGQPSLETSFEGAWTTGGLRRATGWYDAKGITLGSIYYAWKKSGPVDSGDANWIWGVQLSSDDVLTSFDNSGSLRAAGPGTGTLNSTGSKEFAHVEVYYNAAGGTDGVQYTIYWTRLAVYGDHGLTKRGTASATEAQGFYSSDVIAHALRTWAPLISFTEGSTGTLTPTSFVIPQLEFRDPTTVAEIIRTANRFHLRDWAIWEGQRPGQPTFYYNDRGARGKAWRARIRPAQLEETGQSADRVWNGILVRYQDVDGTSKTVGPTGSGATTEDTSLEDADPLNPANQKGIHRWDVLDMGGVSTPAGAIEVGRRFLEEANQLDTSGQARLVGYVEDDKGVVYPSWRVRAGDTIAFVDAADQSARRIVKTNYSHSDRTNSIDLDAPPEGLAALLERLQVVLVPFGL